MGAIQAAAIVTASIGIAVSVGARAEPWHRESSLERLSSISLLDLEEAFWRCDYQASTRGTGGSPIELCAAIYDALKQRKFGGSFESLLVWWQDNKAVRHAALAALDETPHASRTNEP